MQMPRKKLNIPPTWEIFNLTKRETLQKKSQSRDAHEFQHSDIYSFYNPKIFFSAKHWFMLLRLNLIQIKIYKNVMFLLTISVNLNNNYTSVNKNKILKSQKNHKNRIINGISLNIFKFWCLPNSVEIILMYTTLHSTD